MHTSANPSLASPTIPAARWRTFKALVTAAFGRGRGAITALRLAARGRRKRGAWQRDPPWDVGMDHLAETGFRPWILRP